MTTLSSVAIAAALLDGGGTALAASGAVDAAVDGWAQLGALVLVTLLLCTALASILRRGASASREPEPIPITGPTARLAAQVMAAADRIAALDPPPAVLSEVERLRLLARQSY